MESATQPDAEHGVYYRREDSPGFFLRVLIGLLDWAALAALLIWMRLLLLIAFPDLEGRIQLVLLCIAGWAYLVLLKRSRLGSIGYLAFGVRIVDLRGRAPSVARMTLRLLVSLGFNPFFDLIYLTSDASRQGLRDKMCGTYVVNRSAMAAGQGPFTYANLFFLGTALVYKEVKRGI